MHSYNVLSSVISVALESIRSLKGVLSRLWVDRALGTATQTRPPLSVKDESSRPGEAGPFLSRGTGVKKITGA